jgi:DNA repair protein RecO (recombination protein O)
MTAEKMTYHATGIILKREPWRDTARIYTIYTRETGKVLAVARGTRKPLSKLAAHLEPYSVVELLLAHGRRTDTICGAVLQRSPEPLAHETERHAAAAFVAEAFDHFVKWGERDERLWSLLSSFFSDCGRESSDQVGPLLAGFLWRFVDNLGYRPKLESCSDCENGFGLREGLLLPAKGHLLCSDCRPSERDLIGAQPLDTLTMAELRAFFDDETAQTVRSPRSLTAGLAFLEAHLDKPLMSLPVVRQALISVPERAMVFGQ